MKKCFMEAKKLNKQIYDFLIKKMSHVLTEIEQVDLEEDEKIILHAKGLAYTEVLNFITSIENKNI